MRLFKISLTFPPPFSPAWNYLQDILSSVHNDHVLESNKSILYNSFSVRSPVDRTSSIYSLTYVICGNLYFMLWTLTDSW